MKRLWLIVVLLVVLLTPVVAPRVAAAHESAFKHELVGTVGTGYNVAITTTVNGYRLGGLDSGERVIIIGRDVNNEWYWVRTRLGIGYIRAAALQALVDFSGVPVVQVDLSTPPLPPATPVDDLALYPVFPTFTPFMQEVYRRGLAAGNLPNIFSKIGDCMTADKNLFLGQFGSKDYDLGPYSYLQEIIDYYSRAAVAGGDKNSFEADSQAAITGFSVASVEDAMWTNPALCNTNETPLACEYRRSQPSIAIIMFGTNDVTNLKPEEFDFYFRLVVWDSIHQGVVPLLMTFPGNPHQLEKSHQINQIIFQVARDYDVPVANLWLALQSLPNGGLNLGSMYLSRLNSTRVSYFTPDNLLYGYTLRNLVTLKALDILWHGIVKAP